MVPWSVKVMMGRERERETSSGDRRGNVRGIAGGGRDIMGRREM